MTDSLHNLLSDLFLMQFDWCVGVTQIVLSAAWCSAVEGLLYCFGDMHGTTKAADPVLDLISVWLLDTVNCNINEKSALFL